MASLERRAHALIDSKKVNIGGIGALLLFCFTFSAFIPAFAGEEHYTNIVVGERPAGMGGAYTAISDDSTGLYYNPAGVIYGAGKNLNVSTNGFYASLTTYENAIGNQSWVRTSSILLPNFFGITQPLGPGVLGFSYAVPDSVLEDQDQIFERPTSRYDVFAINFNKEDSSYNAGPSYSMQVTPTLSIGLTLYLHHRNKQVINNLFLTKTNKKNIWQNTYLETEEYGSRPLLGIMWTPAEGKFSFGMSISKTTVYWSPTAFQQVYKEGLSEEELTILKSNLETAYGGPAFPVPWSQDTLTTVLSLLGYRLDNDILTREIRTKSTEQRELPTKIALGIAWFPNNALLISFDYNYYSETKGNKELSINPKIAVSNYSIGMEYYLADTWALRAGAFNDMTNTYPVGQEGSDEHIDLYGLSASLTHFSKGTSLSAGFSYGFGAGQAQKGNEPIADANMNSILLFLGSSVAY
ncbi:MAG: hypothetical protein OEY64_07915 [Nitrospinota bacterium]|nr:hypothetical protein [Nitrospinota bacterium]